ncbi:FRIGIDA-like protein 3 [Pyrus ussuriensis x Pyrus communis]|uniref:FRIGIDA-like protein n=1 Tax=Pyrus ussuriensis x Pyrus communis TaxID=2448454 RepID=A0A5N5HQD2_9ROSA|nr:FRIGIDA-like protein 3 [Pyrus ussuriensis x Pyrus communis]
MTPELRKSFNLLKTHASKIANFTLQWQDLEEHFRSIDNSIQSKLDQLQKQQSEETHLASAPQSQPKESELNFKPNSEEPQLGSGDAQLSSKESQVTATLQSFKTQFDSVETQVKTDEPLPEMSTCNGVPINDGKALLLYVNEHLKERGSVRDGVADALKVSVDAGKLVLEAVKWFYPPESNKGGKELDVTVTRKSCAILLQGLVNVKPVIKPDIIRESMKLALAWKAKVITQMSKSLEVWAFFQLLDAFGLGGEFDSDEILKLFSCVADRNSAPELFRSLGFADKASDFIQKLVSENQRLDAVRFSHAYGQFDKFPPVPLLKAHLKFITKDARTSSKRGQDRLKAQDEAIDKEIAALRGTIRCVEDYKLVVEPEYSPEILGKRIRQLRKERKERKERKATLTAPGPKAQPQPLSGKKRTAPGQPNKQNRNKHPRTARALAAQTVSFRGPATVRTIHPSYIRQVSLYDSRSAEYLLSSAGMPRQVTTLPGTSYGTISTLNPLQASHHQQGGSFIGQGAEYPSRYYDSAHYAPDTNNNLSARSYDLVGSSPGTRGQLMNLTARDYGLTGPSHVHTNSELGGSGHVTSDLSPLVARYRTSIAANGRTGQLGSAGSPTPVRIASPNSSIPYAYRDPIRAPNYNDRAVPSSSGYGAPSQHPPAIYHL